MTKSTGARALPEGIDRLPNGNLRVRYYDQHGKRRTKVFGERDLALAKRWRRDRLHARDTGTLVDERASRVTLTQRHELRLTRARLRPSTRALHERLWTKHVEPRIGEKLIGAFNAADSLDFLAALDQTKLGPAIKRQIHALVRAVFADAVTDRLIVENPFRSIKMSRVPPAVVHVLDPVEVRKIMDEIPARYRALVAVAMGTGARQGEVFGLTVDRVNMLRRQVRIDRQLVYVPGTPPGFGPLKTDKDGDGGGVRVLPLPKWVVGELAAHMKAFPPGADGLIFTNAKGAPIIRSSFHGAIWKPTLTKAGLPTSTHFHWLRHSFASILIASGEQPMVVQQRMGHRTASMTLDVYGHLWRDDEDRTRQALDAAFAPPAATPLRRVK